MNAEQRCRIYAVIEAAPRALARVEAALAVGDIAALLVAPAGELGLAEETAAPLIAAAQGADVAALIAGDARLAHVLSADGVHLGAGKHMVETYADARRRLGERAIVGADCGISRHDAMALAESGGDYIAFGAPSHLHDRAKGRTRRDGLVAWWAEIFEVPCVAFDVESAQEAKTLSAAGADFIAVALPAGAGEVGELLAEITRAIAR